MLSLFALVLTGAVSDVTGAELVGFVAVGVVGLAAVGGLVIAAARED